MEALKGHNSQIIRTITEAKNMIITLAEENSHDHKNLDYSIREVIKRAEQVAESVEVGFFFYNGISIDIQNNIAIY